MAKRILKLALLFAMMSSTTILNAASPKAARKYWVNTMLRIATPVYENLANETLRENMPVEVNDGSTTGKRADVSHLEALGRSFNGIAPWLNLGDEDSAEGKQRKAMTDLVVKAIANAVNPIIGINLNECPVCAEAVNRKTFNVSNLHLPSPLFLLSAPLFYIKFLQ